MEVRHERCKKGRRIRKGANQPTTSSSFIITMSIENNPVSATPATPAAKPAVSVQTNVNATQQAQQGKGNKQRFGKKQGNAPVANAPKL